MKVLIINGSPRKKGCTYTALSEAEKIFREQGIESEIINVGSEVRRGCIACEKCYETGKCIFDDDIVNSVIEKITGADGLIVGSPVYFGGINGSLSSLMDRVFFLKSAKFALKPAAAVCCARRAGGATAVDEINRYFATAQMPIVSSTCWNIVYGEEADEVYEDLEGMQTVHNLAYNMAWILKCIEAGRQTGVKAPQAEEGQWTNFVR